MEDMKTAVVGVIFDEENRVLTIKRRDVPMWVLPGGGLDPGEIPKEAVKREILEETGIEVEIIRKVAEYEPINRLTRFVHLYECRPTGGQLTTGDETFDLGYFPLDQLPAPFFHVHEEWIADTLLKEPDVIKRQLTSVSWGRFLLYFFRHPLRVLRFVLSQIGFPINA